MNKTNWAIMGLLGVAVVAILFTAGAVLENFMEGQEMTSLKSMASSYEKEKEETPSKKETLKSILEEVVRPSLKSASETNSKGEAMAFKKTTRILDVRPKACGKQVCKEVFVELAFLTDDKRTVICSVQGKEFFFSVLRQDHIPVIFEGKGKYLFSGDSIVGLRLLKINEVSVDTSGLCELSSRTAEEVGLVE